MILLSPTFSASLNTGLGYGAVFTTVLAGLSVIFFIFTIENRKKRNNLKRFALENPNVSGAMLLEMTYYATGTDVVAAEEMLQMEDPPFRMEKKK